MGVFQFLIVAAMNLMTHQLAASPARPVMAGQGFRNAAELDARIQTIL
jgi:hypothetical protein